MGHMNKEEIGALIFILLMALAIYVTFSFGV